MLSVSGPGSCYNGKFDLNSWVIRRAFDTVLNDTTGSENSFLSFKLCLNEKIDNLKD